jgi:hypothetical protein
LSNDGQMLFDRENIRNAIRANIGGVPVLLAIYGALPSYMASLDNDMDQLQISGTVRYIYDILANLPSHF